MSYLIILFIGIFIGGFIGILQFTKEKSNIEVEEYFTNTGKRGYKIFKIESGTNEKGKKSKYRNCLGEVVEED